MNGIVIDIDPVILSLGHFQLRWYSLLVMLAIVAAVMITVRLAKRKGISPDHIYYGVPWAVLGGVVRARLFYVIDHGEHYLANPTQILGGAGAAIYGALAGGVVAAVLYAKIRRIPLGRAADSLAPGLLVGQMIGRVGCIINGDVWGRVTDLPWAFIYTHPNAMLPRALLGQPTHPYPA
jgi:phosphatidylglycerol:prolipoprotein diacylglycerol transferase